MQSRMKLYGEIRRVSSDDERMVFGYASTDQMAADGQAITIDALRAALEDYMRFANIREMHQLSAVGTAREAEVDDGGLYIGAWVQDDDAWDKVKTGVYRGFSIGAKVTARDPADLKRVIGITLNEISLVDRPADPGAVFDVFRAASNKQDGPMTDETENGAAAEAPETEALPAVAAEPTVEAMIAEAPPAVAETSAKEPEVDPVARALAAAEAAQVSLTAACDKAERAVKGEPVAIVLPGADLRRGLGTVHALGYLLAELCYYAQDARIEAAIEGDGSLVPAKLRAAVVALVAAYKAMSDEELAEMLQGVDVDVALEAGIIQLAACGSELERAAAHTISAETGSRLQAALDGVIKRGWQPDLTSAAQVLTAERDGAIAARDALVRTVDGMAQQMTAMADRIGRLEAQPLPAKTAGPGATPAAVARTVGKGEDTSGQVAPPSLSDDDVKRALAAMPDDDRALILTRAALARPYPISR